MDSNPSPDTRAVLNGQSEVASKRTSALHAFSWLSALPLAPWMLNLMEVDRHLLTQRIRPTRLVARAAENEVESKHGRAGVSAHAITRARRPDLIGDIEVASTAAMATNTSMSSESMNGLPCLVTFIAGPSLHVIKRVTSRVIGR